MTRPKFTEELKIDAIKRVLRVVEITLKQKNP